MHRMGNLTYAAYANQRMTLHVKIAKILSKSGIRWSRCVVNPRGVFSSFMFLLRRLAMPHMRRGDMKTRHFFLHSKRVAMNLNLTHRGKLRPLAFPCELNRGQREKKNENHKHCNGRIFCLTEHFVGKENHKDQLFKLQRTWFCRDC